MCADHCQRARWTGVQVKCATGGAVHPQVRRQPISCAPATPCKKQSIMCADHCQRARWTGVQVRCATGGAVHPQVRRQPISRAPATPCKNSQSCVQIIASEPDGQVPKSDVQQVALYTHKSGGSQLVVPLLHLAKTVNRVCRSLPASQMDRCPSQMCSRWRCTPTSQEAAN